MDMNGWCGAQTSDIAEGVFDEGYGGDCGVAGMALRDFLVANYGRLQRRLRRYLGCPDLASDSLHDAWLRLGDMDIGATVQSPEAYVYRVACNIAMDRLRGSRLRLWTGPAEAELEDLADPAPGPELIAEARSDVEAVERALQHLPQRHQGVLLALRVEKLTRHEVAACYGISLRRVDTMLRQALDYCAGESGYPLAAGERSSQAGRGFSRWRGVGAVSPAAEALQR